MANDDLDEIRNGLAVNAEELARHLLGEPNRHKSSRSELRFRGSGALKVTLTGPYAGRWKDFETDDKGDGLALIMREKGLSFAEAVRYARSFLGLPEPATSLQDSDDGLAFLDGFLKSVAAQKQALAAGQSEEEAERAADTVNSAFEQEQQREREAQEVQRQAEQVARKEKRAKADAEAAENHRRKAEYARAIWARSQPVAGTLGETYLTDVRAIPRPPEGFPDAIRFDPVERTIVFGAFDDAGNLARLQRIFLRPDGRNLKEGGRSKKLTLNALPEDAGRYPVVLPARADCIDPDVVLFAEGPETGVTVWCATGCETWISLGMTRKLVPPPGKITVVCRDDDNLRANNGRNAATAIRKAMAEWREAGHRVVAADPWEIRKGDKSDFNDLLKAHGLDAVRDRIATAINAVRFALRNSGLTVEEARVLVAREVGGFRQEISRDGFYIDTGNRSEIATAVNAGVGTGKTEQALHETEAALLACRARGEDHVAVFAVPQHSLAEDVVKRFDELTQGRLTAAVLRGREANTPNGDPMCRNLPEVRRVQIAVGDVTEIVCAVCPFKDGCAYLAQSRVQADLYFVSHAALFGGRPPPPVLRGRPIELIIIDESFWQAGLYGVGQQRMLLPLDALVSGAMPLPQGMNASEARNTQLAAEAAEAAGDHAQANRLKEILWRSKWRNEQGERLRLLRTALHAAALANGEGPMRRVVLSKHMPFKDYSFGDEGFLHFANAAEWGRRVEVTPDVRTDDEAAAHHPNATLATMTAVWLTVEALLFGTEDNDFLSGELAVEIGKDGARYLVVKGRHEVHEGWDAPRLILDADLLISAVREYFPRVKWSGEPINAAAPYMRVHQLLKPFGKSSLQPPKKLKNGASAEEKKKFEAAVAASRRKRDEVRRFVTLKHWQNGGRTLLIANKSIRELLEKEGLPPGVEVAHFNAIRGIDLWKDVRSIFIVGRPMPSPRHGEWLAEALHGQAVSPLPPSTYYPPGDYVRVVMGPDGLGRMVIEEGPRHPNPKVNELLRWIVESEINQAIGRGRGVNRTADTPLDVYLLNDVVVDHFVELLPPDILDMPPDILMLAESGIAVSSPKDAARLYPQVWKSEEAAKKGFQRKDGVSISGTFPNNIYLLENVPEIGSFQYRLPGKGQQTKTGLFLKSVIADAGAWLEERLGPLALFQTIEPDRNPADAADAAGYNEGSETKILV